MFYNTLNTHYSMGLEIVNSATRHALRVLHADCFSYLLKFGSQGLDGNALFKKLFLKSLPCNDFLMGQMTRTESTCGIRTAGCFDKPVRLML